MFQSRIRKARAQARPVRMSGVDLTSVSEMAPMLQGKMFLIAGLLDAVPMIGVGIAMYLIFAVQL